MVNEISSERLPAVQIEDLVDQLAEMASSGGASAATFHTELVEGAVSALAAVAGAFYAVVGPQGQLELAATVRLDAAEGVSEFIRLDPHLRLLQSVAQSGEPIEVPPSPDSRVTNGHLHNTTAYLLLVCPVVVDEETVGLIEIFQRANTSRDARRGFLRFLETLAEIAADFRRNVDLKRLREQAGIWARFEQFAEKVHTHLDRNRVAFYVANEGRRLVDCDRLSVGVMRGRRCRMLAVSGQDSPDHRSNVLRRLEPLCNAVAKAREPLWWGDEEVALPPQVQSRLRKYLDESHARVLGVIPLLEPLDENRTKHRRRVLGVVVVERFDSEHDSDATQRRGEVVARHAAVALHNAQTHQGLPFFPVIRAIQRATWFVRLRQLPKTLLVLGLIAAVIAALVFVPADFTISGRGELQPKIRRDVFARAPGEVTEILVEHGQEVGPDQELVRLRRSELDLEIARVLGELQTANARLTSVQSARLRRIPGQSLQEAEIRKSELEGEKAELDEKIASLQNELAILQEQTQELTVTSPIDGRVLTWDVKPLLAQRPVERGQILMTVAQVAGPWVLEIRVPDHDIGHVLAARKEFGEELPVEFVLATDPETTYRGVVSKVALSTETDPEEGATVLVTVRIDRDEIPPPLLRPGATVVPEIQCGRRSIGYVWFHDLWDAIRTYVLF